MQRLTKPARYIGNLGMYYSSIRGKAISYCGVKKSNSKFNIINISNNTSSGSLGPTCWGKKKHSWRRKPFHQHYRGEEKASIQRCYKSSPRHLIDHMTYEFKGKINKLSKHCNAYVTLIITHKSRILPICAHHSILSQSKEYNQHLVPKPK